MSANRLFAEWERRLSAEGLRPLDGLTGCFSTFERGNSSASHVSFQDWMADLPGEMEEARFWRLVGVAVHELPRNFKHRAFLVAVCADGNIEASRRSACLSRKAARWAWRKFVLSCGLRDPYERTVGREAKPAIAPCRRLSRREIARLGLD